MTARQSELAFAGSLRSQRVYTLAHSLARHFVRLPDLVVAHPSACFESADFRVTISLLPKRKINSAQRAVRKLRAVLWPHIGAARSVRFVAARLVSSSRRNMSSEYRGSRNVGGQHLPQFCDRKCGEDALEAGISLELPRLCAGSYRHEALELSERWHKIGGQTRHRTNGVLSDESLVPLAGIEPALLAELDFESSASTSSATGAFGGDFRQDAHGSLRSRRTIASSPAGSTRTDVITHRLDSVRSGRYDPL